MVRELGQVFESQRDPNTDETKFYNFSKIRHSEPLLISLQNKILDSVGHRVPVPCQMASQSSKPKEKIKFFFLVSLV